MNRMKKKLCNVKLVTIILENYQATLFNCLHLIQCDCLVNFESVFVSGYRFLIFEWKKLADGIYLSYRQKLNDDLDNDVFDGCDLPDTSIYKLCARERERVYKMRWKIQWLGRRRQNKQTFFLKDHNLNGIELSHSHKNGRKTQTVFFCPFRISKATLYYWCCF